MTDAEFMLEYVAKERKRVIESFPSRSISSRSKQYLAKLDALEALVRMNCRCQKRILFNNSKVVTLKECQRCEALRKFRVQIEGR